MTNDGKGGRRPNMVVLGAIVAAALIVALLLIWTSRKSTEVNEHVETRMSAAAEQT
jgi:hypothetical protein